MFRVFFTSFLLFVCVLSHSQGTFKPKKVNYEDSLFCWDFKQSRAILKNIIKAKYSDSIMIANDSVKTRMENIISGKNDTIVLLKVDNKKQRNLVSEEKNKVKNYKKYGKWGLVVSFLIGLIL
jgi:anionic cell wall polymer biosynthesis LytR-Cps2A-Psr (LCP) family protein